MRNTFHLTSLISLPVNPRHLVGKSYLTAFCQDNDQLFENKGSDLGAPEKGFVQCSCKASLCSDLKKKGGGRKQLAVVQ